MENKLTDDQMNAGCLMLACLSVLLASSLIALGVAMIVVVARGVVLGW